MKTIKSIEIQQAVEKMAHYACTHLAPDFVSALSAAAKAETSERCRFAMDVLLQNAQAAAVADVPLCQDTGMAVFFVSLGADVHIDGSLTDAINEGVRRAYTNGLRASVLDPLSRKNTEDNTPAIIHLSLVEGDNLRIDFMPKGFGAENMTKLYMLFPSAGKEGVISKVAEAASQAGACPCPPYVIGVGIGGTAEKAVEMAKHSLLREVGSPNPDAELAELESEIKSRVNALKIGASGFGGDVTALDVHVEKFATHIAGLPVAVCFGCNAMRRKAVVL